MEICDRLCAHIPHRHPRRDSKKSFTATPADARVSVSSLSLVLNKMFSCAEREKEKHRERENHDINIIYETSYDRNVGKRGITR